MSRVYAEPIEVWLRDGRPGRFVWRERLYVVHRVLEHWVATREWWRKASEHEASEREFWRVEARNDHETGIYELRFDSATGGWLLSRVWD